MKDELSADWAVSRDAAVSRIGDEIVLLHLGTGTYFGLDAVGAKVWQGLEAARPTEDICDGIASEFGEKRERVRVDVAAFLRKLADNRLIERR